MNSRYTKWILFAAGALIKIDVNVGGRLALGELIMIAILPFALSSLPQLKKNRNLYLISQWLIVWMFGAILSDVLNHNSFDYMLKGFFRPVTCYAILISCFHLSYKNPRNIYYFFIGLLISGTQNILMPTDSRVGGADAVGTYQYYAYTYTPFFLGLCSVGGYYLYRKSIVAASILCITLGVIAFPIMSRTTASVLLLTGVLIYVSNKTNLTVNWRYKDVQLGKIIGTGFIIYCLAFYPYVYCAGNGLLGERQKEKFEHQYYASSLVQNPVGFLFAGRVETVGAMVRVARSPIIGNGSWPRRGDSNVVAAKLVGIDEDEISDNMFDFDYRDPGHSVFFGIWSQSGICVVPFFLLCLVYSLRMFKYVVAGGNRDIILITPYMLIFIFSFFFNNFNSTFRFELLLFPLLSYYYRTNQLQ